VIELALVDDHDFHLELVLHFLDSHSSQTTPIELEKLPIIAD
jgi:hypothetical protein